MTTNRLCPNFAALTVAEQDAALSSASELGTHEAADLPKSAAKRQAGTAVCLQSESVGDCPLLCWHRLTNWHATSGGPVET